MSKNPFLNAGAATLYIIIVATVMNTASRYAPKDTPDTVMAPIAILSLFTLSAAVMGYLFVSEPLQMFLAGEKKKGVTLFLQTVAIFAVITLIVLFLAFSKII